MITKKTNTFTSSDGKTKIYVAMWVPDEKDFPKPLGVLQICHGMAEYIDRYDEFARYIAGKGMVVVGNDHLGHGHSVLSDDDYGFIADKKPEDKIVEDVYKLTVLVKKMYPGIPYVLMGHSMGSFITRKYICNYASELDAVIIMGTGHQSILKVWTGLLLSQAVGLVKGDRFRSRLINNAFFGSYNRKIPDAKTANDWLTRDEEIVAKYNSNKWNTFCFTVNGFKCLMKVILDGRKKKNVLRIPSDLPMLITSGLADPVGDYGKGVLRAYSLYHRYIDDIDLCMYEDCRHELCNETNRNEIFTDISEWIFSKIKE